MLPLSKVAVIVVFGRVLFIPVSVANDVSFHMVPASGTKGDVVAVVAVLVLAELIVLVGFVTHPAADTETNTVKRTAIATINSNRIQVGY